MLLTISTTYRPATDLGYLLHKNPSRLQEFELSFGKAYVFYPEATEELCSAVLLLDVDPVAMVRGKGTSRTTGPLEQYVNDRPYVASSFMSVAIARIFGSALHGRCSEKPELVATEIPLEVKIAVLPCRGGESFLRDLFEPLGYVVKAEGHPLDEKFPEWGRSSYFTVNLKKTATLSQLLTHLYVLIPVLDNYKHYYISDEEMNKLLSKGEGWLARHPKKEIIASRYLKFQASLARQALARLSEEDNPIIAPREEQSESGEEIFEKRINLNEERLNVVISVLKGTGATRVLDLGCGEGKLLQLLLRDKSFEEITGMDVSIRALEIASSKLKLDRMPERQKKRIRIIHGSLMYRDRRLEGFDAAAAVEVIEHMDPPRLKTFERVLFEFARPGFVVITTPNREYNALLKGMRAGELRHRDHRFEWDRKEFREWAETIAAQYAYEVKLLSVGKEDENAGAPTQMALFSNEENR